VVVVWAPAIPLVIEYVPSSNWTGCPRSPGFLSDTLLIILTVPSASVNEVLINSGLVNSAFALDEAILISLFPKPLLEASLVIA